MINCETIFDHQCDFAGRMYPSGGDDSARILAKAVETGGLVELAPGVFNIVGNIRTSLPIKLVGSGMDLTKVICTHNQHGAIIIDSTSPTIRVSRPYFSDLEFNGQVESLGFDEHRHLLSLNGVEDVVIDRCRFVGFRGDAIYFGSGPDGGQERHNSNVCVRDCEFDGVNNNNRNAISVVDCDGVSIRGNSFINTCRPDMPGAIDIEPNAFLWHIVKNISISNNRFKNIGGNVGVVAFTLNQITLTTPPGGFSVTCNDFDVAGADCVSVVHSNAVRDIGLLVSGNRASACRRFFNIETVVKGVTIIGNVATCTAGSLLCGFNSTDKIIDANVSGNTFIAPVDVINSSGIAFAGADNLLISGNIFRGQLLRAVVGGWASGAAILNTAILGNRATGIRNGGQYAFEHLGGWDTATSVYENNGPASTNLI